MTDFVRFTKIYTNCSEIQNLQNLCFEFQNNLCKPLKSDENSSYILEQNMLIWQRITFTEGRQSSKYARWSTGCAYQN